MRILFLSPKRNALEDPTPGWLRIPQLPLSILDALTPGEHEVTTFEEEDGPPPLDEKWDLVGISIMTANAQRGYELAGKFRDNGALVVLGGIHPSVMPEEAIKYADSVVIGEAEGIWDRVLEDAKAGRLESFYRNTRPDISKSPLPVRKRRKSFLGLPPYIMPIMFSRGCPNDCEFCCVHTVFGRRQRFIPVENIVADIEKTGANKLIFLDDNIGGKRSYALDLFRAIKPLKVKWFAQASARTVLDDEVFKAMVEAGCKGLFIGVESVEPHVMKTIRKSFDSTDHYVKAINRCRKAGVIFHASLIFGLDDQKPDVFDKTLDFLYENSVPSVSPNILTPYPGTRLFERLLDEGRILHTNWRYYDHSTVSYQPKNMSPEELSERYLDFREKYFSMSSIMRRLPAQMFVKPLVYLGMNLSYRGTTKELRQLTGEYFKWLDSMPRRPVRRQDVEGVKTGASPHAATV